MSNSNININLSYFILNRIIVAENSIIIIEEITYLRRGSYQNYKNEHRFQNSTQIMPEIAYF